IYGDGEQTRDYVFVHDVVRANLAATDLDAGALRGEGGLDDAAFNVGTGQETSVNRLAELLEAAAGTQSAREHLSPRPGELRRSALDAARFARFGWSPATDIESGLRDTFQSIARTRGQP